jgi:trans-aconitate 2-methyltransferase
MVKHMTWSPAQYVQFENERTRPVWDLLAPLPDATVARVVDLGCGPGNSTEVLKQRFPNALVSGFDSSAEMVEAARLRLPDVSFEIEDIRNWDGKGGPFDVILANAVLQWVPDHAALLPALVAALAPRGSLAVQMPDNLEEPSHRLMRETAGQGPWASKLTEASEARLSGLEANWYYRVLRDLGATVNLWRTTYYHSLAGGPGAIIEWLKATGLRPFLQPLDEAERSAFLERYRTAIAKAYPAFPDGTVLLPFPRLFFVATL